MLTIAFRTNIIVCAPRASKVSPETTTDPEQELLRANLDSLKHHDKMLLYGRKGEGGADFGAGVEFADQMIEL